MPDSCWKQEVSRRLAAHKSRRGLSTPIPAVSAQTWATASSRAAQAAARVAARYAQAPSYSQMLAAEACPVPRVVEIAPQPPAPRSVEVAPQPETQARAALQRVPDPDTEALRSEAPRVKASAWPSVWDWEPTLAPVRPAAPVSLDDWESKSFHALAEPDFGLRAFEPVPTAAQRAEQVFTSPPQILRELPDLRDERWEEETILPVEPDLPISANLIEFPRELVAPRKMRPRRIEGPLATDGSERQLSIFEVDPGLLDLEPQSAIVSPVWPRSNWLEIKLEAQPINEPDFQTVPAPLSDLYLAPISRRITATLVDSALIACAFLASALVAAASIGHRPPTRIIELSALAALLLVSLLYHAFFLALDEATPGMRLARLSLCTFDGQIPTRPRLRRRMSALLLSVLPMGLGVAWVLFDDEHLSWHDRLSQTYLRAY